jgi:LmbE family N-acetylglucosaminyl deacetylase
MHVLLDVSPYVEQKLASMRCHRTQITPDWTFEHVPWDVTLALLGQEYLIQAHPAVAVGTPPTKDFLAALPL